MFDLYLITDPECGDRLVEVTERALAGAPPGRVAVQLRLKPWSDDRRRAAAIRLREVTARAATALFINTDLTLAQDVGADGVQLPERGPTVVQARAQLGAGVSIGVSCHDDTGLDAAQAAGADFATLSPFHSVDGKGPPLERACARGWMRQRGLPVLALGGMTAARAGDAIADGAAGVAVVRAVYGAADPNAAVRSLLAALDRAHS